VEGQQSLVVGPGIATFAPDLDLAQGQHLPGLVGDEIDDVDPSFTGVLLGATPIEVTKHAGTVTAGAGLWIGPGDNHVFDAGTFDWSWGLDPRYSAALPGFPAEPFETLMARVLAWVGAPPPA
jgi:hypothetical protein